LKKKSSPSKAIPTSSLTALQMKIITLKSSDMLELKKIAIDG